MNRPPVLLSPSPDISVVTLPPFPDGTSPPGRLPLPTPFSWDLVILPTLTFPCPFSLCSLSVGSLLTCYMPASGPTTSLQTLVAGCSPSVVMCVLPQMGLTVIVSLPTQNE